MHEIFIIFIFILEKVYPTHSRVVIIYLFPFIEGIGVGPHKLE